LAIRDKETKERHFEVEDLQEKLDAIARKAHDEIQDMKNKQKSQSAKVLVLQR